MAHTTEFDDELIGMDIAGKGYGPDAQQQNAIKSIDNTVVAAGAGSGKTEVLARRYAYLLMTDPELHVKNILALTFTKKAASEIYARVYRILSDYRDFLKKPEHNGRYEGKDKPVELAERAIKEFSDARIQTLDSYSNDIVKAAVARYGIKPDYTAGTTGNINKLALKFAVENIENPAFAECFANYSKPGKIEDFAAKYIADPVSKYTSIATKDGWFSENLKIQLKNIYKGWNGLFETADDENDDENNLCPDKAWRMLKAKFPTDISKATESFLNDSYMPLKKVLEDYSSVLDNGFGHFKIEEKDGPEQIFAKTSSLQKFLDAMNKVKFNRGGLYTPMGPFIKYFKLDEESVNFARVVNSLISFIEKYDATEQLCKLLDKFLYQINSSKRITGNLSFKDISELAMKVLDEQVDILKEQQSLIQKIMIDEFQDNNKMNMDLLVKIAGDSTEKLFFVGDEKQSIYKFRGADVSVFNSLKNNRELIKSFWMMNNNYRSSPELLKAFNELFGQQVSGGKQPSQKAVDGQYYDSPSLFYMDKIQSSPVPAYEALYLDKLLEDPEKSNFATKPDSKGMDVVKNVDLNDHKNIKIHACVLNSGMNAPYSKCENFNDNKKQNIVINEHETAAFFIAAKIKALKESGRIKNYSDCAVLDCSRTHRDKLQQYFSLADIPFCVDVQKNIFKEGILNDFYNFLRICVYPNDTVAFSSFLASPFVNMSPLGVESLMSEVLSVSEKVVDEDGNETIKGFSAFDGSFNTIKFDLSVEDENKLNDARKFYEIMKKKVLSSSITSVIQYLWYDTGYFYETKLSKKAQIVGEQFDLLYQIAIDAENQGQNIQWFIDQLAITKQAEVSFAQTEDGELETDDVHYPLEKSDAVTIMTIHQSKGLEFEHVFVLGAFGKPKADKQVEYYYDSENGVSFKPGVGEDNYFFISKKELEDGKSLAELKRLIYVAITRARQSVYLVGNLAHSGFCEKTKEGLYKKDGNPSIMHKIVRHYYEDFLYKDNKYEFKDDYVFVEPAEFKGNAPFDFYAVNPVPAKARVDVDFFKKVYTTLNCNEVEIVDSSKETESKSCSAAESGLVSELKGSLPAASSPSGLEKVEHEALSDAQELKSVIDSINNNGQKTYYEALAKFFKDSSNIASEKNDEEETSLKQEFHAGTFGNMVHSFMENWVNTGRIEQNVNLLIFDPKIAKAVDDNFEAQQQEELFKICSKMTDAFAQSDLGKQVIAAKNSGKVCKAENEFRMNLEGVIFNGAVDLFFENADGTFTLVDYKTDGVLDPSKYYEQQSCYRYALEKIYNIEIKECWLYFTRYEEAVNITQQVKEMTSEKIKEKILKFNEGQQ